MSEFIEFQAILNTTTVPVLVNKESIVKVHHGNYANQTIIHLIDKNTLTVELDYDSVKKLIVKQKRAGTF